MINHENYGDWQRLKPGMVVYHRPLTTLKCTNKCNDTNRMCIKNATFISAKEISSAFIHNRVTQGGAVHSQSQTMVLFKESCA